MIYPWNCVYFTSLVPRQLPKQNSWHNEKYDYELLQRKNRVVDLADYIEIHSYLIYHASEVMSHVHVLRTIRNIWWVQDYGFVVSNSCRINVSKRNVKYETGRILAVTGETNMKQNALFMFHKLTIKRILRHFKKIYSEFISVNLQKCKRRNCYNI